MPLCNTMQGRNVQCQKGPREPAILLLSFLKAWNALCLILFEREEECITKKSSQVKRFFSNGTQKAFHQGQQWQFQAKWHLLLKAKMILFLAGDFSQVQIVKHCSIYLFKILLQLVLKRLMPEYKVVLVRNKPSAA